MTRRAPRVGSSLRQLVHWALANTLKQKFDLENALVRDKLGGDAGTLPFGSTVVNVREVVPGGAFGRWVPLLLALVAGGLGGAGLATWRTPSAIPLEAPRPASEPWQARQPAETPAAGLPSAADGGGEQRAPAGAPAHPPSAAPTLLDGILEWELLGDEHGQTP